VSRLKVGALIRAKIGSDEEIIAALRREELPVLLIVGEEFSRRSDGFYEKRIKLLENDRVVVHTEPYLERYYEVVISDNA